MGKPNGKSPYFSTADAMIKAAEMADNMPVRTKDFNDQRTATNGVLGMLQQQITSMDIAMGLMIETFGKSIEVQESTNEQGELVRELVSVPWPKEQVEEFKLEHKRRFEQFQKKMVEAVETTKKRVLLA